MPKRVKNRDSFLNPYIETPDDDSPRKPQRGTFRSRTVRLAEFSAFVTSLGSFVDALWHRGTSNLGPLHDLLPLRVPL